MTCIVALEHNGKVYMGGDSAASDETSIQLVDHPKVFKRKDFLIGYTTSFRMGQLLEYGLNVPDNDGQDDLYYLVTFFIPAVRELFRVGGFMTLSNNVETGGCFLLGYHGKAYMICDNFQITRMTEGYLAVGSGSNFALGALEAMKRLSNMVGIDAENVIPENIVHTALTVSAKFNPFVRAPFTILSD